MKTSSQPEAFFKLLIHLTHFQRVLKLKQSVEFKLYIAL